jgi:hypothetical protein
MLWKVLKHWKLEVLKEKCPDCDILLRTVQVELLVCHITSRRARVIQVGECWPGFQVGEQKL